jgi:hypothetical protein
MIEKFRILSGGKDLLILWAGRRGWWVEKAGAGTPDRA